MLLLNGRKMSKSEDNSIMPGELFEGTNPLMSKAYSPMTLRFFMLQAHYRSTLNITDDALQAAEKGLQRLMEANEILQAMQYEGAEAVEQGFDIKINKVLDGAFADMDEDFNTPNALAKLFGLVTDIQKVKNGQQSLNAMSEATFARLKTDLKAFIFDIFGLLDENKSGGNDGNAEIIDGLMQMVINYRKEVREAKDWAKSDAIRDQLLAIGVQIKDGKEGATWSKV